ncbi:MAG: hypothetical protein LBS51_03875 [Oscillospiraceae bacterium]|jgi:hypothetical protein|nr:hypothetical protein [Oscillospiraceae bacterium]
MKKHLWKLAAGICLVLAIQFLLVSCSSPAEREGTVEDTVEDTAEGTWEGTWEGTYYSWSDNGDLARIITIEMTGSDTFKATFGAADVFENGKYSYASIGDYGETEGAGIAETSGIRFTLKGDALEAVILDEDYSPYVNGTAFDGEYQRGDSFEDVFGTDETDVDQDDEDEWGYEEDDGDEYWGDDGDSSYTPAEAPQILIDSNFYYVSVDIEPAISIDFADGYLTIIHNDTGNLSGRTYELYDGFISVTLEEGDEEDGDFAYIAPLQVLQILDLCTLMDMNGNIYALEGSQGTELGAGIGYYYQNADVYANSYLFWEGGMCSFSSGEDDAEIAEYVVDGETITITLDDGDTRTLYIINGRLLESDDGEIFVRL